EMVYPKRDELQRWVLAEAQRVEDEAAKLTDPEEQARMLNGLQLRVQRRVTEEWWKLADELIVRYNDGYYNFPDGRMDFQGGLPQPDWYMRMIGFSDDFYRPTDHYVRPAGKDAYEEAKAGALLSPLVASTSHSFWISLADQQQQQQQQQAAAVDYSTLAPPSGLIKSGTLFKRRPRTGIFSRRWVEVRGGMVLWFKLMDVKEHQLASVRCLAGATIVAAEACPQEEELPLGGERNGVSSLVLGGGRRTKKGRSLSMFTVYLAKRPGLKIEPLVFAAPRSDERPQWIRAFLRATSWKYFDRLPLAMSASGGGVPASKDEGGNGAVPRCTTQPGLRLSGLILVDVISAKNLMAADWGGNSDPYVVLEFDNRQCSTRTVYEDLNPEYGQILQLPVFHDDPSWSLSFYVYDEDELSADDLLGVATLPLHALKQNTSLVWKLKLRSEKPKVTDKLDRGELLVRTYYKTQKWTQMFCISSDRSRNVCITHRPEFSIDMFKLQVRRLKHFMAVCKPWLAGIAEILQWRKPRSTVRFYVVYTVCILFLTDWLLCLVLAGILYAILRAHPQYPRFYIKYLRPLRLSFLAKDDFDWKHALDQGGRNQYNNQKASRVMKDSPPSRMSMLSTSGRASLLDRAAAGYPDESDEDDDSEQQEMCIHVYECERRKVTAPPFRF
ncbi:hypothetical protein FOZ62_022988, partial [Perkinsus olseni]